MTTILLIHQSGKLSVSTLYVPAIQVNIDPIINAPQFADDPILSWEALDPQTLPDRKWRGAWRKDGTDVVIDLAAAKNLAIQAIRDHRAQILRDLDANYIEALENEDTPLLNQIKNKKQFWRDAPATPALVNANSINALESVLNNILNNNSNLPAAASPKSK